jgi:hypothetical protein
VSTYGVGAVILGRGLATTAGASLDLVHRVVRGGRVLGLLCNHVGDVCWTCQWMESNNVSDGYGQRTAVSGLFFIVDRHDGGVDVCM